MDVAEDRMVVCKHKVALFFAAFPDAVDEFHQEVEESERKYEEQMREREEDRRQRIADYVESLSEKETRDLLVDTLIENEDLYRNHW